MPETVPGFIKKQNEFSAYIRNPENNPAPDDIEKRRMAMYRELFFNNINTFISSNFPVLRKILDDRRWFDLVQDFFNVHSCKTPYFSEIPEEFIHFLKYERKSNEQDPPFLLELAHYEWVEMILSIARGEVQETKSLSMEQLAESTIRLSSLAMPLAYVFPVHLISPDFQPEQPPEQQTFLVAYRTKDYRVRFMEITPVTYRLLQLVQENEVLTARDCLLKIVDEMGYLEPEVVVINNGLQIVERLLQKGIVTTV